MLKLKTLFAASAAALCCVSAVAQENGYSDENARVEAMQLGFKPYPYGFVQVQGGVSTTLTDVNPLKILSPTFSIAGGYQFSPIVGARLHVNGIKAKGGFDTMAENYAGLTAWNEAEGGFALINGKVMKYNYNYINTNADLMLNVLNIVSPKCYHPVDLYLIGGIGLNYAWDNSEFEKLTEQYNVKTDISNAWGDKQTPRTSLLGHNIRLGLLADYNINKNFSVGAEINFNSLDDRFNSKYKDADDWMVTAQLSVTYKFGRAKNAKISNLTTIAPITSAATHTAQQAEAAEAAAKLAEAKKAQEAEAARKAAETTSKTMPQTAKFAEVEEDEPLKDAIFYAIRESDVDNESLLQRVVTWCKKYPKKTITIDGYADKDTGNPSLNVSYAQKRAKAVADALKKMGVPASQMKVSSHGDKIQPFAENDKNRCVIIEGK